MMIAALYCAVSCGDELNPEQSGNVEYINVTSQVDAHTKAGYEGTTVLPEMFYIEVDQEGTDMDYRLPLTRETGTANYKAETDMKWKGSSASVKAMTVPYGLTSVDMENTMAVAIHQEQNDPENLKASDLLGASTKNGSIEMNGKNIVVTFNHLMSKLQVNYTKPVDIEVTSVVLKNTCVKGGYSFKDMSYDPNISGIYGNITMYHDSEKSSAEAIFFPYAPASNPELIVNTTINGVNYAFECPIVLKNGMSGFDGGKRYVMSVTISKTGIEGVVTMIKNWNGSASMDDERILWIGTSIPAGSGYPEMVGEALGCEVINNAVGGSLVTMQSDHTKTWEPQLDGTQKWNYLLAGALSQTISEAEANYASYTPAERQSVIDLSYESRIMPYINGTEGYPQCSTVIIDHGYNDLSSMLFERNAFNWGNEPFIGYSNLKALIELGESHYKDYYNVITTPPFNEVFYPNGCYIIAMKRIIDDIKSVNPDVRIIIGNYFTQKNPLLSLRFKILNEQPDLIGFYSDYEHYAEMICRYNEAVASVCDLDIVNVYDHLYIEEDMFCDLENNVYINGKADETNSTFCPDGVHPSLTAGRAIADIYIRALRDILR